MTQKKLTVSIPDHLVDHAQRYAADEGLNLSAYISAALAATVEQEHVRRHQQFMADPEIKAWADELNADCLAEDLKATWANWPDDDGADVAPAPAAAA